MRKNRFYCSTCKEYRDRREVISDGEIIPKYYCRYCSRAVIQIGKVRAALIQATIDKIVESGCEEGYH